MNEIDTFLQVLAATRGGKIEIVTHIESNGFLRGGFVAMLAGCQILHIGTFVSYLHLVSGRYWSAIRDQVDT